jgi:hypothetical protein
VSKDRHKEIKERRGAIVGWPWEVCAADDYFIEGAYSTRRDLGDFNLYDNCVAEICNRMEDVGRGNALFIASAPKDIDTLLADNNALREACKKALTCASLDSSVRALIVAALTGVAEERE